MRQYLNLALVLLAGVFLIAGCTTSDQAAIKRSLYVDEHPELPEMTAEAILNGQVMVGMTEEMVETAWGKPVRIEPVDKDDGPGDVAMRWIYGNYFVGGNITSLYFTEDGLLARYEVNNEDTHANSGVVSTAGNGTETLTRSKSDDFLLGKGSGQP
jgi:hypothetical protein